MICGQRGEDGGGTEGPSPLGFGLSRNSRAPNGPLSAEGTGPYHTHGHKCTFPNVRRQDTR